MFRRDLLKSLALLPFVNFNSLVAAPVESIELVTTVVNDYSFLLTTDSGIVEIPAIKVTIHDKVEYIGDINDFTGAVTDTVLVSKNGSKRGRTIQVFPPRTFCLCVGDSVRWIVGN